MIDIENIAYSRIAEPLSKGDNVKKLLKLHITPYIEQNENNIILQDLKNLDVSAGAFLEWLGIIKGVQRPNSTFYSEKVNSFLNLFNNDVLTFGDALSKPLYFNQKDYYRVGDLYFRKIIKAYCYLTNFRGTVDEYSYFFKEIFNINIKVIRLENFNMGFVLENSKNYIVDLDLIQTLTPVLPQTKNEIFISPYNLFSLEFANIKGTNLDFSGEESSSFYFSF